MAAPAPVVTFQDLDNSVRNGKKKLYWSAFEVVLATAQPNGAAPVETRYDAYQVNHNHLKKLHAGARGPHYVRVECKYCTAPRFTQSITVSTKKFEEHYMTLHALDALASADVKKAQQQQQRKRGSTEDDEGDEEEEEEEEGEEETRSRPKRTRPSESAKSAKRARRGALTRDDDDHVAAMQGAAAAVVALSGGPPARAPESTSETAATATNTTTATTLPSSLVDSSVVLDPADSDTKRAKKSYWTAYEVVICERVPRPTGDAGTEEPPTSDGMVTRETRQDAWRVNHNALRRLHLDPENDTTVRVECRFCDEPKFNQSITVSTRKFEQHYYYEHGDESQRQELDERLAAKAAAEGNDSANVATAMQEGTMAVYMPKRRKSWRALLIERESSAMATTAGPSTSASRSAAARYQRAMLLNWLVHDFVPLSTVGSDHFQAFAASLDRKAEVPTPLVLRTQLQQRYDAACTSMKKQLQDELAAGTALTLSVDTFPVRSGEQEATFVTVTVHYVSREWERRRHVLACRSVPNASNLESVWTVVYCKVLPEFGLPLESFVSVTVRTIDAISVASIGLAPLGSRPRKPSAITMLCAATGLETIAEAGADAVRREFKDLASIGSSATWMELYATLSTLVSDPQSKHTLETVGKAQAVARLFEPFVRVAQDMGSTSYPTIPMVFQYLRHLKEVLEECSDTTVAPVVKAMQTALEGVFDKVIAANALVAYVLDPRFRFAQVSGVDEKPIRARILAEIAAISPGAEATATPTESTGRSDASMEAASSGRQNRSLFEELATTGRRTSTGSTTSASTPTTASANGTSGSAELDEYLGLEDEDFSVNVLQWWQAHEAQFPSLARVARQFLGLVGTSLPAEELFKEAGRQLVMRRSVLEVETVEATVVSRAHPEPVEALAAPARARVTSPATDPKRRKTNASSPLATMPVAPVPAPAPDTNDKESEAIVV